MEEKYIKIRGKNEIISGYLTPNVVYFDAVNQIIDKLCASALTSSLIWNCVLINMFACII